MSSVETASSAAQKPFGVLLREAFACDDAAAVEELLKTQPAIPPQAIKILLKSAIENERPNCFRLLMRDAYRTLIDIDAPLFENVNAITLTLFPKLDLDGTFVGTRQSPDYSLSPVRFEMARALLEAGANPSQNQPLYPRPLVLELVNRRMDKEAVLLLQYGADVEISVGEERVSLILAAFQKECLLTRDVLMDKPVNFNCHVNGGKGLAYFAAENGWYDQLLPLQKRGVDLFAPSDDGTILKHALFASNEDFDFVVALAKQDPRPVVNFGTSGHWTPLHVAIDMQKKARAYILLQELKADANAQTYRGVTPVMVAAKNNDVSQLRMLKRFGARLDTKDNNGRNALYYAIADGGLEVFEYLLRQGVRIYQQDAYGETLLHTATRRGRYELLERVFELVPNWQRARRADGKTALELLDPRDEKTVAVWMKLAPAETQKHLQQCAENPTLIQKSRPIKIGEIGRQRSGQ